MPERINITKWPHYYMQQNHRQRPNANINRPTGAEKRFLRCAEENNKDDTISN